MAIRLGMREPIAGATVTLATVFAVVGSGDWRVVFEAAPRGRDEPTGLVIAISRGFTAGIEDEWSAVCRVADSGWVGFGMMAIDSDSSVFGCRETGRSHTNRSYFVIDQPDSHCSVLFPTGLTPTTTPITASVLVISNNSFI